MSMIRPGFRGILAVTEGSGEEAVTEGSGEEAVTGYVRASSIDVKVKQDAQEFLPAYGGVGLKRIPKLYWVKRRPNAILSCTFRPYLAGAKN